MLTVWLIDLCFAALCVAAGVTGGVWLGTRRRAAAGEKPRARTREQTQKATRDSLHGISAAVETVQACVRQHSECLNVIGSELRGGDATDAAASIVEANQLAAHQFRELRGDLDARANEVREQLGPPGWLMLTSLTLDRQKHAYQQVLSSLEELAAEMVGELDGCGKRIDHVSGDLANRPKATTADVRTAITHLLDATDELHRSADDAEDRLEKSAEKVHMQAIMSHADMLTSLPNRKALEEQLSRETSSNGRKAPPCCVLLADLDHFHDVNARYGFQGGDMVLRQAATLLKRTSRGQDTTARVGGDCFALTLLGKTLSEALPAAERVRDAVARARFSEGNHRLELTASVGIIQVQQGESPADAINRALLAVGAARGAGGDCCYYNDGRESYPISAAHKKREEEDRRPADPNFGDSLGVGGDAEELKKGVPSPHREPEPTLCGRSIFVTNLKQRLAEWRRGVGTVSVVLMRIDQVADLVERHDEKALTFLRRVMGRLLEAATRDMDNRCDYDMGVYAVLLPHTEEPEAIVIAERLKSQVQHCKLRLGNELWDLSASIGVADANAAHTAVDLLMCAAAGMEQAMREGGDAVRSGAAAQTRPTP